MASLCTNWVGSDETVVLEINDKIGTNMLVSLVISGTEMESRDFSHPVAMYSECSHSVAFERFLLVFANVSIQVHPSAPNFHDNSVEKAQTSTPN